MRKQARADFEWTLGDHLVRFGYDHENDTSDYSRYYAGPGAFYYNLYAASAGTTIPNGGVMPAGYDAYVRARRYEISGTFTTKNAAYYVEDNWQVTPNLVLNAGVRNDSFDNQDAAGRQLHQDEPADRAATGLLLGHEGRRQHQAVRQPRPLFPAGGQRDQHQAGRRSARRAHLLRVRRLGLSRPSTACSTRSRNSARRSAQSTIRRATAPSATCARKSITTWTRSTRTRRSWASSS